MKKYLMMGAAAIALASCSHDVDLYNPDLADQMVLEKYNQAFINNFGVPAASQDWGFGGATRGVTRAASTWTDNHSCNWADKLNVVLPEGATEMTSPGWLSSGVYVVPTNGSVSLGWAGFNEGDKIYILGDVTELKDVNYNGKVTFYNVGTLTYSVSSGGRHTIINTGTLTINSYGNVGELYNSGTLNLVKVYNPYYQDPNAIADIPNEMSIFSTGEGSVLMPDGGDFKAAADIHGTLEADEDTKIQNKETQYICGVKVDGVLDMTQGHLQSSNIEATEIKFDGAEIWLTAGGHVKADVINMPNSATTIYGESTSTGLIEVEDINFQNTNNFDDSFSGNIYFKITGEIDFSNSTKFGGKGKHYANVEAYNDDNTVLKGYAEGDNATGSPACGQPWKIGTPTTTPEPDPDPDPDPEPEYKFLARVFCEDLSATDGSDFDFNDVVFDVYTNGTDAEIEVLAAGGTLPLKVAGEEVHALFGVSTSVMVNTKAADYTTVGGEENLKASKRIPVEGVSTMNDLSEIEIWVQKDNGGGAAVWYKLEAPQGQAAAKFAVAEQIGWVRERQDIKLVYTGFENWVQQNNNAKWYEDIANDNDLIK